MRDQLLRIANAINYMADIENQDRTLVVEMAENMIRDLATEGELAPMIHYVKMYCDVTDSQEDSERIAREIEGN